MPLQTSGIIVVDKTSVVSPINVSTLTTTIAPSAKRHQINNNNNNHNNNNQNKVQIHHISLPQAQTQQQQQQRLHQEHDIRAYQIYQERCNENDFSSISTVTKANNLMRRQQRAVSISHPPISSSVSSSAASSVTKGIQNNKTGINNISFVAASPNFNQNQMSQTLSQQQQQLHHHQPHHHTTVLQATTNHQGQHVIQVSEDFIEHAGFAKAAGSVGPGTANVINIAAANDIINQTQIIKLVSDGNGGNMLIDSLGTVTNANSNHHHPNSKLVVGNLTVLSKQQSAAGQQPQTLNFVNTKGLSYLTSTAGAGPGGIGNNVGGVGSSGTGGITIKNQHQGANSVQKIVNFPLKTNNVAKNSPISQQLHHQHHINNNANSTVMQKVTVPRNVQVVTRVQNIQPQPVQHLPSLQQQQQPLPPSQQQHQQQHHQQIQQSQQQIQQQHNLQNNQMIMQQKYVPSIVSVPNIVNNTTPKVNNTLKKQTVNQAKHQKNNAHSAQGVKTFVQQQQMQIQQPQQFQTPTQNVRQIKSTKVMRQLNNTQNVNNSQATATALTVQQQQQSQQAINTGSYTINNAGKINFSVQQSQHQQNAQTKLVGGANAGKNSSINTSTKYIMPNHIVLPMVAPTPANSSINQHSKLNNSNQGSDIVIQQRIINTINTSVCGNINSTGSGTIKFMNAHSTVLQPQQQSTTAIHHHKVRNNNVHPQILQQHIKHVQHQPQYSEAQFGNNITAPGLMGSGSGAGGGHQTIPSTDDIMIVNGTQMTDEISARILQSMSQKSNFNSQQRQFQSQQQKSLPGPPVAPSSQSNYILAPPAPREYPIYNSGHGITQTVHHQRQAHSNPGSRSQSLDRKHQQQQQQQQFLLQQQQQQQQQLHDTVNLINKSADVFKVNTKEKQQASSSPPTIYFENIPLPCPLQRDDDAPATQQAEHDDDIIGEEVKPVPISTHDTRLQVLYAVLNDHTYVVPMPTPTPTPMPTSMPTPAPSATATATATATAMTTATRLPNEVQSSNVVTAPQMNVTSGGNASSSGSNAMSNSSGIYTMSGGCMVGQSTGGNSITTTGGIPIQVQAGSGMNTSGSYGNIPSTGGFPFIPGVMPRRPQDDDANSVISNESRNGRELDNDLGEETETAPEAEGEDEDDDDSVTRCICDLPHDDGYMICCDKCSAWQHVDCMGIDRQNIPDEYLCEICQPRPVDKARARSLQLMKRKEQTQLLMNAQLNAAGTAGGLMSSDTNNQLAGGNQNRAQPGGALNKSGNHPNSANLKKGKQAGAKKRELVKKMKKEKPGTKKRETVKRTSKRKTKNSNNDSQTDKQTSNLREWIENYEQAVTNHYSPELRARLHTFVKQQNLQQIITPTENKILRNCGNLENRCTTVPHAGGKILISNLNIQPNSPIIELRGKYMLTTQYKNQNTSVHMNMPPTSGFQSVKNQNTPGPFVFFYQLSQDSSVGPEVCVDTRTYGNEARFVRRSCRPNAEIQHSFGKGTIHLYLVSLTNIMASTEITIRHEPHDLIALENKNPNYPVAPTSTICACGLAKDCAFGGNLIIPVVKPSRKVTVNGCLNEGGKLDGKTQEASETQPTDNKFTFFARKAGVKKTSQNHGRGRSTSSSGESNAGLLSPNNNFTPNLFSSASISSLLHDSGVYTSSSSPSVSLPSPTHTQTINSPPQQTAQQTVPSAIQIQETQQNPISVPSTTSVPSSVATTITTTNNPNPPPAKSPQKSSSGTRKTPAKQARHSISDDSNQAGATSASSQNTPSEKRESRKLTREERKMEAIVKAFEKMEKNQQRKQELKQAKTSSGSLGKRRNSSSPSPKRSKTVSVSESGGENSGGTSSHQQHPANNKKPTTRKKKRKGSKSYQTQSSIQRKRRRSRINSNESDMVTSEESTSLLSPNISAGGVANCAPPLPVSCSVHHEVPEIVEKQMTLMTDLLESQANGDGGISQAAGLLMAFAHPDKSVEHQDKTSPLRLSNFSRLRRKSETSSLHTPGIQESIKAQMLMLSQMQSHNQMKSGVEELETGISLQQRMSENSSLQQPPIVSSTCLLVEAAVGPLENLEAGVLSAGNEFKVPIKTKTKKSIMNDWLNQSSDVTQEMIYQNALVVEEMEAVATAAAAAAAVASAASAVSAANSPSSNEVVQIPSSISKLNYPRKSLDTLVQAAATICEYRRGNTSSPIPSYMATQQQQQQQQIEPQNLTMVAKKVEEFINQSDANFVCSEEMLMKGEGCSDQISNQLSLSLQNLNNSSNSSGSSSVKKRWLRQAISEETDENISNFPPASSPTQQTATPNGFTTPLKKRRVVRQCNDGSNDEQMTSSPEDMGHSKNGDSNFGQEGGQMSNDSKTDDDMEMSSVKQDGNELEDDVDILNSPSPTEKVATDNDNLVNMKSGDVNKESKIDVKEEESSSNETATKKNELESVSDNVQLKSEVKIDPVVGFKQEAMKKEELFSPKVKFEFSSEDFKKSSTSPTPPNQLENFENFSDEIADIQKRLHSFHTENIMILQSRNKKSKIARSLKLSRECDVKNECDLDETNRHLGKDEKSEKKLTKGSKKEQRYKSSKKRQSIGNKQSPSPPKSSRTDSRKLKDSTSSSKSEPDRRYEDIKIETRRDSNMENLKEPLRSKDEHRIKIESAMRMESVFKCSDNILKMDDKQLQAALTIPNFNQNIIPPPVGIVGAIAASPNPIPGYVLNTATIPSNQGYDLTTLLNAPPPPPPPLSPKGVVTTVQNLNLGQPPPLHLPYYNTIYGKLMDNGTSTNTSSVGTPSSTTGSNLLLSDYLDTKAKSYSTLGGYVSHTALFGLNSGKTNTSVPNSSVNSSIGTSTGTISSIDPILPSPANTTKGASKILTKTASSDPRLNPILTAPEPPPAPKRKLSINEYRKRKQQSTEIATSTTSTVSGGTETPSSPNSTNEKTSSSVNAYSGTKNSSNGLENGDKSNDSSNINGENEMVIETPKVQFSPAPTMLEQQQEILCERLKSLKNKAAVVASLGTSGSSSLLNCNSMSSPSSTLSLSSLKCVSDGDGAKQTTVTTAVGRDLFLSPQVQQSKIDITENRNNSNSFVTNAGVNNTKRNLESISSSSSPSPTSETSTPERTTTPLLFDQKTFSPDHDNNDEAGNDSVKPPPPQPSTTNDNHKSSE